MTYLRKQILSLLFYNSVVIPRKAKAVLAYKTPAPSVVVF